ncbi:VirB4 family type IV secretion system protein [Parachitinimonas caeni]|uniref:CagE TrbE VirB component of type IV transporter system central domain-containing protein n=1 Tax=Parachitinimonas caeni TaxID=3031301 RepID=A0ABT7E4H8_9NEIS|nr:hypothetical protein [Parachitinimonas caeni]MDK2126263.1 hypothetical protein [Parachitinimonas caeni]
MVIDLAARLRQYQTLPNGEEIRSSAELLPYLFTQGHQQSLVVNKDAGLLACFELAGVDAEALENTEVNLLARKLATQLARQDQWPPIIWLTVNRQVQPPPPPRELAHPMARTFDQALRAPLLASRNLVNSHYLSLLAPATSNRHAWLDRFRHHYQRTGQLGQAVIETLRSTLLGDQAFAYMAGELDAASLRFEEILKEFSDSLKELGLQRLSGQRLLGFLHGMASPLHESQERVAVPQDVPLDTWLGDCVIYPHGKVIQLVGSQTRYAAALSIKAWPIRPDGTRPRMLESLLRLPVEMRVSLCWRILPREEALSRLTRKIRFYEAASRPLASYIMALTKGKDDKPTEPPKEDAGAVEAVKALKDTEASLQSRHGALGYGNLTILIFADTPAQLEQDVARVEETLRQKRLTPIRETLHLTSAFAGSLPGQWGELVRWRELTADQVADLAPIHTIDRGQRINHYLTEQTGRTIPALAQFLTEHGTLFNFNFHVNDYGHTLVIGRTRGGKTVLINMLTLAWQAYGKVRVIRLDRDRSCRIATLITGGIWIDTASDRARVNPLIHLSDTRHRRFLCNWLEQLASSFGHAVSAEDSTEIARCLDIMAKELSPSLWRLGTFSLHLRRQELKQAFAPWVEGGAYASVFDHAVDDMALSDNLCVDLGGILQSPRAVEHFFALFLYRIEDLLNHQPDDERVPTFIYLEEGGVMLKYPWFAREADSLLKRLGKKLAHLVITVQSPEDVESIRASARDNIATKIFIPSPRVSNESLSQIYASEFDLNPRQLEQIIHATPKRQYLVKQDELSRLITTNLTPEALYFLRSDKLAQDLFDRHWRGGQGVVGWEKAYLDALKPLPDEDDGDEDY